MALANHKSMSITFDNISNSYTIKQDGNIMLDYPGSDNGIIKISEGAFVGVDITSANIIFNIDEWGNFLNSGTISVNETHNISISRLTGKWNITEQ